MMISVIEEKVKQRQVIESSGLWMRSNLNRISRGDLTKKVVLSKYLKLVTQ